MIMKSSYRIFRISGISVELHISFIFVFFIALFIAAIYGFSQYTDIYRLIYATFYGIKVFAFFVLLFGTVLIHEFAHSLIALRNNVEVPKITLTPLGGAASIDIPENPQIELKTSIAGPAINFIFVFLCLIILLIYWPDYLQIDTLIQYVFIDRVFEDIFEIPNIFVIFTTLNFILGVFNLLPAFPMDGGRVLRSSLALWMDYVKATRIAVQISQIFAVLMFVIGLGTSFMLVLISIFILFAGPSELKIVKLKHAIRGLKTGDIAVRDLKHVEGSLTLDKFLEQIAIPSQGYYPVTDLNKRVIGILDIQDVIGVDREKFDRIPVRDVARKRFEVLDANLDAEDVLTRLLSKNFHLVVDSGKVIGYITPGHLFETAQFYSILKK